MADTGELQDFRAETRAWLTANFPSSLAGRLEVFAGGNKEQIIDPDVRRWFEVCYERGWSVPHWPAEYGGGGLEPDRLRVLREEMARVRAPAPLGGMGVTMIGPTLLEHGTDDQKTRHLPKIASGELRWCQGYSEPGAGSDLAALKTRAEDKGDYYLVNGSKVWTTGANYADWIFCLVRTDFGAPKHEGISFVLFSMDNPGVTVKPIVLISGSSPFCECFFDDVKVPKDELVGKENRGWTIAKRLLQHERSSISGLGGGGRNRQAGSALQALAKRYCGEVDGKIADDERRRRVLGVNMDTRAFLLTQQRASFENTSGGTPTFATSMFKYFSSELAKRRQELTISLLGTRGVGWEGTAVEDDQIAVEDDQIAFDDDEIAATRMWLRGKAGTIAGGTSEVQLNIVAKRVLGLPD